jgi:hypothetical protein
MLFLAAKSIDKFVLFPGLPLHGIVRLLPCFHNGLGIFGVACWEESLRDVILLSAPDYVFVALVESKIIFALQRNSQE